MGGGGKQTFNWGEGGQEGVIAMKGVQSKVKWGANEGPWCELKNSKQINHNNIQNK